MTAEEMSAAVQQCLKTTYKELKPPLENDFLILFRV